MSTKKVSRTNSNKVSKTDRKTASSAETPPSKADQPMTLNRAFSRSANHVATAAGKPWVFATALLTVLIWIVTGPIFNYSDTWQLVINTGTTIITFLMVFLIQNSQNRDGAAIQVKLDELIRVSAAKNSFVGIEHLTEDEIGRVRDICESNARGRLAVKKISAEAKKAADAAG
jgi:low affinity Fe/Cu permease